MLPSCLLAALPALGGAYPSRVIAPAFEGRDHAQLWGDVDGDGLVDIYVLNAHGADRLFVNLGDGTFADATEAVGLAGHAGTRLAVFEDFDRDGAVDLLLVTAEGGLCLYRGAGDGTFLDDTELLGLGGVRGAADAEWIDYDEDGRLDLRLATEAGGPILFHRVEAKAFERVALELPVAPQPGGPAGAVRASTGTAAASGQASEAPAARREGGEFVGTVTPMSGLTVQPGPDATRVVDFKCLDTIEDAAGGPCISASSEPLLDHLYPLTQDLFVDPSGNVGIGTLAPQVRLDVAGQGRVLRALDIRDAGIGLPPALLLTDATSNTVYSVEANVLSGSLSIRDQIANQHRLVIDGSGAVGIGITDPDSNLDVRGQILASGAFGAGYRAFYAATVGGVAKIGATSGGETRGPLAIQTGDTDRIYLDADDGQVAIGEFNGELGNGELVASLVVNFEPADNLPAVRVEKSSTTAIGNYSSLAFKVANQLGALGEYDTTQIADVLEASNNAHGLAFWTRSTAQSWGERVRISSAGNVGIGTTTPLAELDVNGTTRTEVLTITGGSDLAEPFEVAGGDAEPGMLVSIAQDEPGKLVVSKSAYDRTVVGVVSGAGGVNTGLVLSQQDVLDKGRPVALAGRVWCYADAASGAIQPGDLLTASDTPGHAMRVSEHARAVGAIVGKALTPLEEGRGLVLIVVALQ